MGRHHILHFPPSAAPGVDYQRLRLSIFFRWPSAGGGPSIRAEAIDIYYRIDKTEP